MPASRKPKAPARKTRTNGSAPRRANGGNRSRSKRSRWFTERQLNDLEQLIQAEYDRIMRLARDVSDDMIGDRSDAGGSGDSGDLSADREMQAAKSMVLDRSAGETRDLLAALDRLQHSPGTFGVCRSCEGPIAIERLEIIPTATHCALHAN